MQRRRISSYNCLSPGELPWLHAHSSLKPIDGVLLRVTWVAAVCANRTLRSLLAILAHMERHVGGRFSVPADQPDLRSRLIQVCPGRLFLANIFVAKAASVNLAFPIALTMFDLDRAHCHRPSVARVSRGVSSILVHTCVLRSCFGPSSVLFLPGP